MKFTQIKQADRDDLYARMANGEVFMLNEFEQMVVRFTPSGDIFTKLKGGEEFKAQDGSKLVADTLLEGKEITGEVYAAYS